MAGIPTTGEQVIVIQMPETAGGELPKEAPSPASPQDEAKPSKNPVEGNKGGSVKLAMALSAAKTIGMQGLNAAVSNIGLASGNYYQQAKVERVISAGSTMVGLAASFTNIYTAAIALAGLGIQAASENFKQTKEIEIANYQSVQYAKRIGYTVDRR
jgi:hypothetical protein